MASGSREITYPSSPSNSHFPYPDPDLSGPCISIPPYPPPHSHSLPSHHPPGGFRRCPISLVDFPPVSLSPTTLLPPPLLPTLRWDVFLSFRGKDTRLNFTGHLYKALHRVSIRTFRDDSELESGEPISPALLRAIEESNIYIVIFSENYASSPWCLDELVKIHECQKTFNRLVIPVFYKVDPGIVRHQTGSFRGGLEKNQKLYMDKVDKWRLALAEAAEFSGYHIDETTSEADIIEEVIEKILLKTNPRYLDVAKHPVGVDLRVKEITQLLRRSARGVVHTVGIYGMGGVGKTTLAKAVYNANLGSFEYSCFLANISEVAGQHKGIEGLQEQLIFDVFKGKKVSIYNLNRGVSIIREQICWKKVLIVLDDIDDPKQLDYFSVENFASGSVIIVTTRDEGLLDTINVKDRYMVTELDDVESLELFTQHAFGHVKPSDTFMQLSKVILSHAGGLPLALEVFGSNLINQHEIDYWGNFIEKLSRIPNKNIQKKLTISFDALDDDMKNIFLDIACFFIGENKDDAVTKLDSFYHDSNYKIKILVKRCLVRVDNNNKLWMHNLLWDMGRQISRGKSYDEPGEYNRLWDCQDICNVLRQYMGTKAIEGIVPHPRSYCGALYTSSLSSETFQRMRKLRFLYMEDVNLTGSFSQIFKNLRWLHWYSCPSQTLPSDFCPREIVILELPFSRLKRVWDSTMVLQKLRILDLSFSLDLTTTPDFDGVPCLKTLILQGCESLVEVNSSIGCLAKLVYLDLGGCTKLRCLPSSLCDLKALECIHLNASFRLEELPEELGKIERLQVIDLRYTAIRTLPGSICDLRVLEILDIAHCSKLEGLPLELGNIKSLVKLDASETTMSNLPNSIGCLSNLLELKLCNSKLETLPDTVCNLRALELLDISHCSKLEELPNQLGTIKSLRELHSAGNTLKRFPDIGSLSSLQELDLSKTGFASVPLGVSQLPNLKKLRFAHCTCLESIEELPPNLKELHLNGCQSINKIPNLCNLEKLEILNLTYCTSLKEIRGLKEHLTIGKLGIQGCEFAPRTSEISLQMETEIPIFPFCRGKLESSKPDGYETPIQSIMDIINKGSNRMGKQLQKLKEKLRATGGNKDNQQQQDIEEEAKLEDLKTLFGWEEEMSIIWNEI